MSKDIENHSFNESNNLTGNSGMMRLSSLNPNLQPIRLKQIMAEYSSDEEDSEDRGKDSSSDSETEEMQLPEDPDGLSNIQEQSAAAECKLSQFSEITEESKSLKSDSSQSRSGTREFEEKMLRSVSKNFTNNFSLEDSIKNEGLECSKVKNEGQSQELVSQIDLSARKPSIANRRSNLKLETPECAAPIDAPTIKKEENHENSHQSMTCKPHVMETPLKNNPAPGSMRPTPSTSHRCIFQTPQGSKIHQDYSKNHVQTPATIFGNWSQNPMIHTPLQSRLTTSDSSRSQASSYPSISAGNHDLPVYRSNEEKRTRRPLAETTPSSRQNDKLSQYSVETSAAKSYETRRRTLDTVDEKSSNEAQIKQELKENRHPRMIGEEPLTRSASEGMRSSSKEGTEHRSKTRLTFHSSNAQIYEQPENNRAHRTISKTQEKNNLPERLNSLPIYEQPDRFHNSSVPEKIQEKDSLPERPSGGQIYENNHARNATKSSNAQEKNALPERPTKVYEQPESNVKTSNAQEKNNLPERPSNVQASVPTRLRGSNPRQGQTMTVKGKEYMVLGTLGEGMSGQVLRVQDTANHDLRAIKVVDLSRMDKDCAQGCLQEISMLHKLQAPCIIRMFDHEIKFPMVHVVMEIGDTDFKSFLNSMSEKKRLPLTMVLYYWTEMLTAVKHIHDNGVIHSDLKPANFLLVRGRLKLIDFGIASTINADMTSVVKNNPIGTLNYISPEALMDIGGNSGDSPNRHDKYKISFKSDVWSLGCILYSLIFGYTPFYNFRTQWAKINAITNPHPKISFVPPTGQDVEATPSILIDVMKKCLQHDPKARPTVAQLLQIPYIPVKPYLTTSVPDIPSNILMKIKYSLTDEEWRQFTEIMAARRNDC